MKIKKTIIRFIRNLWQAIYRSYGIRANVKTGKGVKLGLGAHVWAPDHMILGDNVRMGKNVTVECNGRIGNNVLIGNNVGLIGRWDHDTSVLGTPVTEAPWIFHKGFNHPTKDMEVIVEDDVWIGYNATVISGVTVGRGAVIGACALVNKDVPPYAVVVGIPAKVVNYRYTPEQVVEHEKKLYGKVVTPQSVLDNRPEPASRAKVDQNLERQPV